MRAKTKKQIKNILEAAREAGMDAVEIDGMKFSTSKSLPAPQVLDPELTIKDVQDMKSLFTNVEQELDPDYILYYSCDYGRELEHQAATRKMKEKTKEELNGEKK